MIKKYKFCTILCSLFCLALFSGCSAPESDGTTGLTVSPDFFNVPDSGGRIQFSASVSGTLNRQVTWSLLSGPGRIDSDTGLYHSARDTGQLVTAVVQATSKNDPTIIGKGRAGLTTIKESTGEPLASGVAELAVGGLFVRTGQMIDLNSDEHLDLISRNTTLDQISFLEGTANKTFVEKTITVSDPVAMVVGDFKGNGVNRFSAELAVASGIDQNIYFFSADPSTGQPTRDDTQTISIGQRPVSLATGKFHDSFRNFPISDLFVGTEAGEIIFFRQDRSKLPFILTPSTPRSVDGKPIQMIPADFDQDGALDLAVLRENTKDLLILFGNGVGDFTPDTTPLFPEIITYLDTGDFNEDDVPDLVATHKVSHQISILLGKGDGSFGTPLQITLTSATGEMAAPGQITIGDFNVGTHDDIAIALPDSKEIFVLFGDGTGKFTADWRYSTEALSPTSLISGFFTGFNAPQGIQSIDLIYMGKDLAGGTKDQFFLLSNQSN